MDFWNEQAVTLAPAGQKPAASQEANRSQGDSFQKLMEQAEAPAKPESRTDAPQKTAAKPEAEGQPECPVDPRELEKQMALAALAMMQNPVVPEEQVVTVDAENIVMAAPPEDWELVPIPWDTAKYGAMVNGRPLQLEQEAETVEKVPGEAALPEAESVMEADAIGQEPEVTVRAVEERPEAIETEDAPERDEEPSGEAPAEAPVFGNVRDIPVKVGEAPKAEEAPQVPVEEQAGRKIAEALEAGETRVELQLEPENLGRVTVEMTVAKDGVLHVALHAENGRTANLLERGLDSLHMMLARDVRQEVQVEVQRHEESQRQNFYDGRQGHGQRQDQRERRQERHEGEDFLQQLRLGLIPEE